MTLRVAAFGILLILALTGCSASSVPESTQPPVPIAESEISPEQKAALEDGKVTYDEYQQGWTRYVACDAKAGFTVEKLGETNQVISGQIPDAAVTSGVDALCYSSEFQQVDATWQVSRQDTSPLADQIRECLTKAGSTPTTTYEGMLEQLKALNISTDSCF